MAEVWINQIDNARNQTNAAIVNLSREFADIVASLDELATLARDFERGEGQLAQAVGTSAQPGSPGVIGQLTESAQLLDQRSTEIRTSVEAALIHLQFQDRVNQMLGHVQSSIRSLTKALAEQATVQGATGHAPAVDFPALLAELERSYTTIEERTTHRSLPSRDADDEITFF